MYSLVWEDTVSSHGLGILSSIHLFGDCSMGGYSFDPRIRNFLTNSLVWWLQSGGPQPRATDFGSCHVLGLQSQGLQFRATDFRFLHAFTCLAATVCWTTVSSHGFGVLSRMHLSGGYTVGRNSVEAQILDLVTYPLVLGLQSQELQFRATDFRFLQAFTCLGATISSHVFWILSRVRASVWKLQCEGYSLEPWMLDLVTHSLV